MHLTAEKAAIATGHPLGAAAGLELLQAGGNAVDAAVAAMLAMCVVVPGSVGIGGYGGSAVVHHGPSKRTVAIDFDSRAPLGFREGDVTADRESNYYGARAVTVPAVVAGLDLILQEFGAKSWTDVSRPAIRLAEQGIEFDSEHRRHAERCAPKFNGQSLGSLFPGGRIPGIGDIWRQPDLARLLNKLAEEGPQAFYEGEIPERIVRYVRERDGILSIEDFEQYRPEVTEAVAVECFAESVDGAVTMYTPPPPSGGITSLAIIQTLEQLDASRMERGSAEFFLAFAEAAKLCWRERHSKLGDPEFVDVSVEELVSRRAAEARAIAIRRAKSGAGTPAGNQSPHTANVIAADAEGTLVSVTATQGWMYGSHLVVEGLGLVLNHGMSRFDYVPGHPNAPAAGKRMQHNMAPMIALRNGRAAFAYGLPGGPKIVTATAQLAVDTIAFGSSAADAVAAPRLHTDGAEPLLVSEQMPAEVVRRLEKSGHAVQREADMGGPVNALAVDAASGRIEIASGEITGAVAGS